LADLKKIPSKLEMARVITRVLNNLPRLPSENHKRVKELAKMKKDTLVPLYQMALTILKKEKVYVHDNTS